VTCVGFDEPGFGSVEDMSSPEHIGRINMSAPDFVVVAIGAKKGQAWIQHNLTRITAPVISYLGAVVNFAAGTVSRAPRWAQAARLEWLWRVMQEPALWRRYANDGFALSKLMLTRVIPCAIDHWLARRASNGARTPPSFERGNGHATLSLSGTWTASRLVELRPQLAAISESGLPVVLDLRDADRLDSAVIGPLLLLYGWQLQSGLGWRVINPSNRCRRSLRLAGAEYLLESR
jgi:N-acetylglucosaminyldiphosphoundecaprenol N-acetyl-beta-D-mannosaminyltransferase